MIGRFFSHSALGIRLPGAQRGRLKSVSSESPGEVRRLAEKTPEVAIMALPWWIVKFGLLLVRLDEVGGS